MTNRTPIEQATIFLSVGRYRRAAEILLQIIMEQEGRLREVEARITPTGYNDITVTDTSGITEPQEVNFMDGLEEDDNFPDPLPGNYCSHCKGPCKRNFCIYCGADFDECKCK